MLPPSAGFYSDPTGFNSICFPGHDSAWDFVLKAVGKQTNKQNNNNKKGEIHSYSPLWRSFQSKDGRMVLALRQVMSDAVWGWFQVLICWPFSHAAAAKSLQSCLTLCDMIDSSPPGSSVPGILQARILEWVAISFSNAC